MPTKIEWTHVPDGSGGFKRGETWNPQVGCREVSPGCRNCYAAKQAHLHAKGIKQHAGLTVVRDPGGVHWNGNINRVPHLLAQPLKWREPRGVFVCSMSDLFFDVDSDDACRWIAAIFGVMAACPQHTFMVLTKRPENAARWFAWLRRSVADDQAGEVSVILGASWDSLPVERRKAIGEAQFVNVAWPLPNVWVGVTAEDQRRADERVLVLLDLPAAVRFVSYEPALGPVDWTPWIGERFSADPLGLDPRNRFTRAPSIDWLICGGESGPDARPMHPDWARSARDQCKPAGTAFFFKQRGEWVDAGESDDWTHYMTFDGRVAKRGEPMPGRTPDEHWDRNIVTLRRVGKAAAGRDIDGRTHDGFPKASQ